MALSFTQEKMQDTRNGVSSYIDIGAQAHYCSWTPICEKSNYRRFVLESLAPNCDTISNGKVQDLRVGTTLLFGQN